MVSFRGQPVPAKDEEVSSLMILDGTDRTVQNQTYVKTGDRVMIMEGPLKGLVGFYLRRKEYRTDLWTLKRIAEVIRRHFGTTYHPNHVWRLLVGMNWSCQKPERRALQRNEEAVERWKRSRWPSTPGSLS